MAIEIIPKAAIRRPAQVNYFYYLSIGLLIVALLSWLLLNQMIKKSRPALEKLEKSLAEQKNSKRDLENEVLGYKAKLENFSRLIDAHKQDSNLFKFIESLTHPNVFFSNFSFSAKDSSVSVSGKSDGFESLGQQLIILNEQPGIKNLQLKKVSLGKEGGVEFELTFNFDPGILTFKPAETPAE